MPEKTNKLSRFWQELRRRKVIPIFIAYLAACFAVIEFLDISSNRFAISNSTFNLLYILAAIGLPLAVILPWYTYRKMPEIPDLIRILDDRDSIPLRRRSLWETVGNFLKQF